MYFLFQGAAPEKWMLEAGEYTMKRFAGLYGMKYKGMATGKAEAEKLGKNLEQLKIPKNISIAGGVAEW